MLTVARCLIQLLVCPEVPGFLEMFGRLRVSALAENLIVLGGVTNDQSRRAALVWLAWFETILSL